MNAVYYVLFFFFFNDTATTEIYTLSLHDALPISSASNSVQISDGSALPVPRWSQKTISLFSVAREDSGRDRKSTRLNSSHANISYAVFCLKKKKKKLVNQQHR